MRNARTTAPATSGKTRRHQARGSGSRDRSHARRSKKAAIQTTTPNRAVATTTRTASSAIAPPPPGLELRRQLVEKLRRDILEGADERRDGRARSTLGKLLDQTSRHRALRLLTLDHRPVRVHPSRAAAPHHPLGDEAIEDFRNRRVDDPALATDVVMELAGGCLLPRPERRKQRPLELSARQDRVVLLAHLRPRVACRRMS